jgi:hypothetical protein
MRLRGGGLWRGGACADEAFATAGKTPYTLVAETAGCGRYEICALETMWSCAGVNILYCREDGVNFCFQGYFIVFRHCQRSLCIQKLLSVNL